MRAKRTVYKGIEFRSRLEALWAVFFDAMQIDWQYEPEQFRMGQHLYTPDFFLPVRNLYIEVKPEVHFEHAYGKYAAFTNKCVQMGKDEKRQYRFVILQGKPHAYGKYPHYTFNYKVLVPVFHRTPKLVQMPMAFAVCPLCHVCDLSEVMLATEDSVKNHINFDVLLCRWCAQMCLHDDTITSSFYNGRVACLTLGHVVLDPSLKAAYKETGAHKF